VAVAELLPGVLSLGDDTVAVFEIVPWLEGAVTGIVIVGAVVLGAIDARVHVTVVIPETVASLQLQSVPEAEPDVYVVPEGSGSETLTDVAVTVDELFVTLIV
jgi:hypothetical protein